MTNVSPGGPGKYGMYETIFKGILFHTNVSPGAIINQPYSWEDKASGALLALDFQSKSANYVALTWLFSFSTTGPRPHLKQVFSPE